MKKEDRDYIMSEIVRRLHTRSPSRSPLIITVMIIIIIELSILYILKS